MQSISVGDLRAAVLDVHYSVFGRRFTSQFSYSGENDVYPIDAETGQPLYLTESTANGLYGSLVLFLTGQNKGLTFMVIYTEGRVDNEAPQNLAVSVDQLLPYPVETGDVFTFLQVPPAYNALGNVQVANTSLSFPASSASGTAQEVVLLGPNYTVPQSRWAVDVQNGCSCAVRIQLHPVMQYDPLFFSGLPPFCIDAKRNRQYRVKGAFSGYQSAQVNAQATYPSSIPMLLTATTLSETGTQQETLSLQLYTG